ncbi:MAG TPA: Gfo/Idh/MocA family oxidoreductase [Solirubrobacterales bacterium]|nr:Gfo/Idh/MocA family oxidoreductase [Solirubrobacterales bacterium]
MRIALLGTGRMAQIRGAALSALPEVKEVLVASPDAERREGFAAAIGGSPCAPASLAAREFDAVVVCTRTSEHREGIELAATRRLPVFCEKPIALGLKETAAVLALCASQGIELQVGFHRRFDTEIARIQELWQGGDLGVPYVARVAAHDRDLTPEHYIPTSGGIWRDLHVHDFDTLRFLSGEEVETVSAAAAVRLHERFSAHEDFDSAAVLLVTESGFPCVVTGTRHNPAGYDVRVEVVGSQMSVAAGVAPPAVLQDCGGEEWLGFAERFAGAFAAEIEAFVELVAGRGPNRCPAGAALEALRVAIACEISAREGRTVRLDEVPVAEEAVQ